jgi:hypothetical protein
VNESEATTATDAQSLSQRLMIGLVLAVSLVLIYEVSCTLYGSITKPESDFSTYRFEVDLRTAGVAQLQLIPNFGETLAARWVDQRADLLKLHPDPLVAISHMEGIGPSKLANIASYAKPEPTVSIKVAGRD